MRLFLIFTIICLLTPLSFAQSQRFNQELYGSYLKGLIYAENSRYKEALEELKKAKGMDPDSVHIRLKMATVFIRLDQIVKAENILKEAKKVEPDNLDISLALIFVYSYAQEDKKLEQEYEHFLKRAHEIKPKDLSISEYLAQFYFYKKRPQDAIEIYEKILISNPEHIDALFWLGYLYDEVGRRDEAIDAWKKGLKLDPNYAPILNSLGYVYAVNEIKLDKAEKMLKKAIEIEPDNGAYLDSLGWVYFKKKEYKKAEKYLFEAVEIVKDPDIYEHLGDLYIKMDQKDKAMNYYKEGIKHFPDNKNLKEKIRRYGE